LIAGMAGKMAGKFAHRVLVKNNEKLRLCSKFFPTSRVRIKDN